MVSVIVTTKNEEKNIANCLESIKAQNLSSQFPISNSQSSFFNSHFPISNSHFPVEIIVVDNNSTDRTKEIARRYTDKVYNFGPERSAQRNFGVEQASGKYILYLDADMILSKNVIAECVKKCLPRRKPACLVAPALAEWYGEAFLRGEKEGYIALYIPEKIVGKGFWVGVRNFERSFYNATCIDCVRFVRRDKFLEIGGFDENLTGPEDWDFDRRIKKVGKAGIIDAPIYHNEGTFNLKKYLRKKTYYSKDLKKYIEKWGEKDKIVRKQLGFCYRYFWVFVENGKWMRLLKHPILTLGMYLLRFRVGIDYLFSN